MHQTLLAFRTKLKVAYIWTQSSYKATVASGRRASTASTAQRSESQHVVETLQLLRSIFSDFYFCMTFLARMRGRLANAYVCTCFCSNKQNTHLAPTCVDLARCRRACTASIAQRKQLSTKEQRTYVRKQSWRESHHVEHAHIYTFIYYTRYSTLAAPKRMKKSKSATIYQIPGIQPLARYKQQLAGDAGRICLRISNLCRIQHYSVSPSSLFRAYDACGVRGVFLAWSSWHLQAVSCHLL